MNDEDLMREGTARQETVTEDAEAERAANGEVVDRTRTRTAQAPAEAGRIQNRDR
jgi:hypothetical protein